MRYTSTVTSDKSFFWKSYLWEVFQYGKMCQLKTVKFKWKHGALDSKVKRYLCCKYQNSFNVAQDFFGFHMIYIIFLNSRRFAMVLASPSCRGLQRGNNLMCTRVYKDARCSDVTSVIIIYHLKLGITTKCFESM